MVGYRMLFGVPDEITDVTRVSGMVRKRRLIYRMTSFGYRKVFVHYRKSFGLIGSVLGVPGGMPGTIRRVSRPKGSHGLWEEINQPLVGWNKFPLRPIRFEKEKTQGGKSFQVGRWNPTPSRIGVGLLHLQFRPNL